MLPKNYRLSMADFLGWLLALFLVLMIILCIATEGRCADRLDTAFKWEKRFSYVAESADAVTTSYQIRRGYVESNSFDNLIISRDSPAYPQRLILLNSESFAMNRIMTYAYGKCGPSKVCKTSVIAGRGLFVFFSIRNSIHNMKLP